MIIKWSTNTLLPKASLIGFKSNYFKKGCYRIAFIGKDIYARPENFKFKVGPIIVKLHRDNEGRIRYGCMGKI